MLTVSLLLFDTAMSSFPSVLKSATTTPVGLRPTGNGAAVEAKKLSNVRSSRSSIRGSASPRRRSPRLTLLPDLLLDRRHEGRNIVRPLCRKHGTGMPQPFHRSV